MAAPRTKTISPIDQSLETERLENNIQPQFHADEYEPADDAETELNNVLADLGGSNDAKINVYKLDNGKRAFVGAFTPSDFSLETIQINYGGGDYDIQVRVSGRFLKRKMVTIAKPIVSPNQNVNQNQNELLQVIMKGFETMNQQIVNLTQNKPEKTTLDTLNELKLMKEIFGSDNSQGKTGSGELQLFLQGIEFAKQTLPKEGETSFTDLALEAVKSLAPAITNAQANNRPPVATVLPPANQPLVTKSPAPLENVESPEPTPESQNMNPIMKMYLNTLIAHAEKDHDPVVYADVVLDTIGDDAALQFVARDDWFEVLAVIDERVKAHEQWFIQLRQAILQLTEPETADNNGDINVQSGTTANASS